MGLLEKTALELGQGIRDGEFTAPEVASALLARIETENAALNAYLSVDTDLTLCRANEVQQQIGKGQLTSPLAGVPMALKDNICTMNLHTTCASKMLKSYLSPYEATVSERLHKDGAVLAGKLNMDEFAMGSTNETSYFGAVNNPWNSRRVSGGSSGGCAAAVAASLAPYALGSDTGGSVRQPASHCGVTGLKPTYGRVSRYGLIAHASSLDQIGPITRDAADAAAVLDCIAGQDCRDATSVKQPTNFLKRLSASVQGIRIGIPGNCFTDGVDADIKNLVLQAGKVFQNQGAVLKEVELPLLRYAVPAYYIIASAEASANLARYDGIRYGCRPQNTETLDELYRHTRNEGFGTEVKRRILLGTFVLSEGFYESYYQKAQQMRAMLRTGFAELFQTCDLLLMPTAPTTAPESRSGLQEPLKQYLSDLFTVPANLAGAPALTFPCGFDRMGMPVGAQLVGPMFGEQALLNAAHSYQSVTDYHIRRPKGGV